VQWAKISSDLSHLVNKRVPSAQFTEITVVSKN
jgi:hypothetical protein